MTSKAAHKTVTLVTRASSGMGNAKSLVFLCTWLGDRVFDQLILAAVRVRREQ